MKWGPALLPFVFASTCFALPSFVFAQVVLNEIMYNPQGSDSGREWVELYNQGQSDVTMVGGSGKGSWRINDGSNHTLIDPSGGIGRGSLTIPAGGYLVIAYDPTDFISGEYAGGTYSVVKSSISLNNSGAAITLLDGTGTTVDTVTYSPSQGGNDDSSSLQRQADGSWIAALPTPGAQNSIVAYVAPPPSTSTSQTTGSSIGDTGASTTNQTSTQQSQSSQPSSSYVPPPTPDIFADAGSDQTVIVGADVEFEASAYDKTQTVLDPSTVRFLWNFGDGATAEGPAVLHHFSYPGTYAVVLEIASDKNSAEDQITVTAQPAALAFSLLPDGGVEIQNLAGHDLDLSDWLVREDDGPFAAQFMLPDHSIILSGSSMNVSAQTLSFRASSSTVLEYPNGAFALAMGESSAKTPENIGEQSTTTVVVEPMAATVPPSKSIPSQTPTSMDSSQGSGDADAPDLSTTASDTQDAILGSPSTSTSSMGSGQTATVSLAPAAPYLWWIGVGALAFAVVAAIIAASHFKKDEWDIAEDRPG